MMKININRFGLRFAMVLVFALCAKVASAENKLYIEPFTIDSYNTYNVPVMLDNSEIAGGFQFDVVLPAELELASNPYKNEDRLESYNSIIYKAANGRVLVYSQPGTQIPGNSGAVVYLPVKLALGASINAKYEMAIANIRVSSSRGATIYSADECKVEVTAIPGTVTLSAAEAPEFVNPDETFQLPVNVANTCAVKSIQANLTLPEGFAVKGVVNGERVIANADVTVTDRKNGVVNVIFAVFNGDNVFSGENGVAYSYEITAPEDFKGQAAFTVDGIVVSYIAGQTIDGTGFTYTVTSGNDAYEKAKAEIEALRAELTAALAAIAEKYPTVADQIKGDAISEEIDALAAEVDEAYADHSLSTDYDDVMAPAEGIREAIAALDGEAAEAARKADNEATYNEMNAVLDYLQEFLGETKAEIEKEYPNADVAEAAAAIQAEIDAARTDLDAAYEAVAAEGTIRFDFDFGAVENKINALKAEAKRQQDNYNAYAEYMAVVDSFQAELNEAKATVAEFYPASDVDALVNAAQAALDAAKAGIEEAYKAVATEGEFAYDLDITALEAPIAKIVPEAKRQAENEAAYTESLEAIAALEKELEEAINTVTTEYPDGSATAELLAAQKAIAEAKEAAKAAYEAVAEEGTYDYTVPTEDIKALIAAFVEKAKNTGIDEIFVDELGDVKLYNVNGVAVKNPAPGTMVIAVSANGEVRKLIVK